MRIGKLKFIIYMDVSLFCAVEYLCSCRFVSTKEQLPMFPGFCGVSSQVNDVYFSAYLNY